MKKAVAIEAGMGEVDCFPEMRRKRQLMQETAAVGILKKGSFGVMGVMGENGYPYTVPLNYVYEDGRIYFHCALEGQKMDGIRKNPKVSFCVVDEARVIPEKFTTAYRSVIAFGRVRVVTGEAERYHGLSLLVSRFSPGYEKEGEKAIKAWEKRALVVVIEIEHMTGKMGEELLKTK